MKDSSTRLHELGELFVSLVFHFLLITQIFLTLVATRSQGRGVRSDQLVPRVKVWLKVSHRLVVVHVVLRCAAVNTQREPMMRRPRKVKS